MWKVRWCFENKREWFYHFEWMGIYAMFWKVDFVTNHLWWSYDYMKSKGGNVIYVYMNSLVSVRVTWWDENPWIALWAYGWHGDSKYMNSLVSVRVTCWDIIIHESLVSIQVSWWDEIHEKPCERTGDMVIPITWIALWAYVWHVKLVLYMKILVSVRMTC